jgi:predicted aldo/keto reductase-like oxidoreductase
MLGKLLADHPRGSFVISTKVPTESGDSTAAARAWLGRVELSLQRLKMDHVDILYLHAVGSKAEVIEPSMLDAIQQAKAKGYARFIGVSTHKNEPEVIDAATDSGVYDVVLTSVNFKQDHYPSVKAAIARAAKAGVGIVGMKTMAGGFLDSQKTKPVNCKAALKFVLQDPNVTTTIPGITSFEQLEENSSINQDLVLTQDEQDALAAGRLEGGLYCQGCEHCVAGCPRGVSIPNYMRAFMYAYGYRDLAMARNVVTQLDAAGDPCGDCSSCSAECVKGFPVRERIADVRRVGLIPEEFLS